MILGIVQTIWNAFLELVSSTLSIDLIFYIGVGFLLLMALFFFIRIRTSYEYKLDKTADRLSDWLFKHQTLTEQNLVEFNNIIKEKKSPKILRKHWQQFMLYRDKAPSEYMSTYNCIDKPLKTSSFTSSIKNFSMIYKITAFVTFFMSMFCFAGRTEGLVNYITQSLVSSLVILFIGVILTLALRAMQNYNIATLYQTFNLFQRYIDKASTTIPKYVDFEILFTKKEIREGIPILGEYLEKRARQEQEELEQAQRNAVSHEEYNFAESGVNGSLVLERAMKESETYINVKQRLLAEIQQFESEISTLKKNYENTSKDYQRKLQASKENMERLRQQQEESTNRIEVNYIRKQQQDEVKKQEQLEKDQEDATNKFNVEINSLTEEIEKRRVDLDNKKLAVQEAMLSEYQTFSSKLHKAIFDDAEKSKNESIEQVNAEKEKYAQAITYLKSEVDGRNELIKSKDQIIEDLTTKLHIAESSAQAMRNHAVAVAQEEAKLKEQEEQATQEAQATEAEEQTVQEATEGHYDDKGYYWWNNGTYHDDQGMYHDLEGNVYDQDGNVVLTGQVVETEFPQEPEPTLEQLKEMEMAQIITQAYEEVAPKEQPATEQNENQSSEQQPEAPAQEQDAPAQKQSVEQNAQAEIAPTEEQAVPAQEPEVLTVQSEEQPQEQANEATQEQPSKDEAPAEQAPLKEDATAKDQTPKRKVGRPKKVQTENTEEKPKRKVGRPKKEQPAGEEKPKRKVGRPKKVQTEDEQPVVKRKAGRPKKEQTAEKTTAKVGRPKKEQPAGEEKPKRKAGRPKKTQDTAQQPAKRKAGRPKKTDSDQSKQLLKQLGQSLINLSDEDNQ